MPVVAAAAAAAGLPQEKLNTSNRRILAISHKSLAGPGGTTVKERGKRGERG